MPERDVIIVGAGLGGLSAAIHLAAAGHRVHMLERNPRPGGRANLIEQDGYRFDTGPSLLNYPWVFENVFAAAGRRMEDYVTLLPVEPSVTFQWRDGTRLPLSSNLDHLIAACEAVEPGCAPGLLRFLRDARAKYDLAFAKLVSTNADSPLAWFGTLRPGEVMRLSVWRSLYSELGRFFRSRYIREAFGAYGMYLGGSPFDLPGFFSILAYGELGYGLWLPKGGIYGLVEGLERLATELGVTIETGCPVDAIETRDGAVTGVRCADGRVLEAGIVVSNVDVPTTDTVLLKNEPALDRRRGRTTKARMTGGVLTFYWGVDGTLPGLGHHTIFLPDDYRRAFDDLFKNGRIPDDLPFYTSLPSATDPSLAPTGKTAMFVLVPTPLLSRMNGVSWTEMAARVKERVLERLACHGVALDPSRIEREHVLSPTDWRDRFGLYDGSAFGGAHTLFQLGPFRARNFAPEIRGLYYTGASTTPGTGMPMVMLSGKLTAERIQSHVR